jgi:hypothetical protein
MTVIRFPGERQDSFRHAQNGAVVYRLLTDIREVKCGEREDEAYESDRFILGFLNVFVT